MRLTTSSGRLAAGVPFSSAGMAALIAAGLVLVFALDRGTGAAPVQHLYYVPIIAAGVRFRMRGGTVAALASVLLYHLANPHLLTFRYEEQDIIQIVLLFTVGIVTAQLTHDRDRMRQLALTDDLTGLHNLRSFETELAAIVASSRREQSPMTLLVLDLDRLKSLNDQHGHLAGAEAVRTVGQLLARTLPSSAVACRYGGDEFAVAIPRCPPLEGQRVAEDLRQAVHASAPALAGRQFAAGTLSISIGGISAVVEDAGPALTGSPGDREPGEAFFRAADAALYRAKAGGRNCVRVETGTDAVSR
jgi:diguanylate cyclase (GGDEF)-like protein